MQPKRREGGAFAQHRKVALHSKEAGIKALFINLGFRGLQTSSARVGSVSPEVNCALVGREVPKQAALVGGPQHPVSGLDWSERLLSGHGVSDLIIGRRDGRRSQDVTGWDGVSGHAFC